MRRQRLRKAAILVAFLLFPVTMFYHSPVLVIVAASQGIVAGCAILFAVQFVASLLVGRLWCAWLCPGAGLQEACFPVQRKRAAGGRWHSVKWIIWVPWVTAIVWMGVSAGGVRTVDPLFQTWYGISIADPRQYVVYYFFVALIAGLAFGLGRRAFCHYVCWMAPLMIIGRRLRDWLGWPALRLQADADKCADCGKCTKVCPMSLDVRDMVQSGSMRHAECILCGECVDACRKHAIHYTFRAGND